MHVRRWLVNGVNLATAALAGEWLCMQKELQEIPTASLRRSAGTGGTSGWRGSSGAVSELAAIAVRQ